MRRGLAVLAVIGLFLIGVLIGAFATHLFYVRLLWQPGEPARARARIISERVYRRLDLAPEQRREIDRILEDARREARAIRDDVRPRIEAQLRQTRERIEAVLTPEQREKFERLARRHRRWAEQFFLGPPGGRRGPSPPPPGEGPGPPGP
jgi:hypothetical protein